MRVIGIYANEQKDTDLKITKKVIALLVSRGIEYCLDEKLASVTGDPHEIDDMHPEAIIVLGGDGTMLGAARRYAATGAKLFGVNLGRMGFLLDTELDSLEDAIDAYIAGKCCTEERLMLSASVFSGETGKLKFRAYALNEAVVSQKNIQRIVNLELYINGVMADSMACDGVIISTPTGSTGYSLSAGGPVVTPSLDVMLVTPVCPHSLDSVNLVISDRDTVELSTSGNTHMAAITLDGQKSFDIDEGDRVVICAADFKARFVKYSNRDFFTVLKGKFADWSER